MRNLTTKDKLNIAIGLLVDRVGIVEASQLYNEATKEYSKLKDKMNNDRLLTEYAVRTTNKKIEYR